jgi:hypothetical protein
MTMTTDTVDSDPTGQLCDGCGVPISSGWNRTFDGNTGRVLSTRCHPCKVDDDLDAFVRTGRLITGLLSWYGISKVDIEYGKRPLRANLVRQFGAHLEPVNEAVEQFEREAWFGGMQKVVRQANTHGLYARWSHDQPGFDVLAYAMAGRVMISIESKACLISLITIEDDHRYGRMGIRGIDADPDQALWLVECARIAWTSKWFDLVESKNVGFAL